MRNASRTLSDIDVRNVTEISVEGVDLIATAAGYEPRCTNLLTTLERDLRPEYIGERTLLVELRSHRDAEAGVLADEVFRRFEPKYRFDADTDDAFLLIDHVRHIVAQAPPRRRVIHVMVDYSCMSRMLYLSLLSLLGERIKLTFVYSIGKYGNAELNYPVAVVGDVRGVPGLEGLPLTSRPRLYVFGLGFDGVGALALAERLEAERLVTFWADPGAKVNSAELVLQQNTRLVTRSVATCRTDLRDVASTVDVLRRFILETRATDKVVFVPVGPKPHILAAGIAAHGQDHATLLAPHLRGGGIRDGIPPIEASGELIVTALTGPGAAAA